MKNSFFYLLTIALLFFVINCGEATPQQAIIKIEPDRKFQKITGWEATAQAGEHHSAAFEKYKDKLLNDAVNDLGINRLRLEILAGVENPVDYFTKWQAGKITNKEYEDKRFEVINDNTDPHIINTDGFQFSEIDSTMEKVVLPMKKLLSERGESLFLNLNYVDFGNESVYERPHTNPEEYAELMLALFSHLQSKYGFVPDAVEIILEPDQSNAWSGNAIGKIIAATGDRLKANNFKPVFIVPSTTNPAKAPAYIDEIAKNPTALKYISEFSYHRYCCASDEVLQRIAERAEKYGKQTAMLEWIGADQDTLQQDLKVGRISSWQQYTLAFPNQPDNGAQYYLIEDKDPNNPILNLGSRTKFLRQYFRYIRAGAQMIGAEASNQNFDPAAFINADGRYVLVIKTAVPGTVTVLGFPSGVYGVSYTTSKESDIKMPDISLKKGEVLKASIPSAGVMTIFARTSSIVK